jgi:phage recombination protein Bet
MTGEIVAAPAPRASLIERTADRYGVDAKRLLPTLKATCFKSSTPASDEQMMALLIVAEQYHLNPFTKELYAYPDKGGIVPVVSVDGWARIINEHPMLDGIDFEYEIDGKVCTAITCILRRKDRSHPIRITEFLDECVRQTEPWRKSPRRMLRHKALIQCARIAFGFAGIYDEDEAARIVNMGHVERVEPASASANRVRDVLQSVAPSPPGLSPEIVDVSDAPEVISPQATPEQLLSEYRLFVERASDSETAALVLDEARDVLPPELHEKLTDAWRARWQPTTDKE